VVTGISAASTGGVLVGAFSFFLTKISLLRYHSLGVGVRTPLSLYEPGMETTQVTPLREKQSPFASAHQLSSR